MPLAEGDRAPEIEALNQDGDPVHVEFEAPTVLYFYPKDDTPGCTLEARQFQHELESYRDAGVDVYGVSMDDVASHEAFCEAQGLEFDLLADPEGSIAHAFDVDRVRGVTARTTFVADDGEVKAVYEDVDPEGHARRVLQDMLDAGIVSLEI